MRAIYTLKFTKYDCWFYWVSVFYKFSYLWKLKNLSHLNGLDINYSKSFDFRGGKYTIIGALCSQYVAVINALWYLIFISIPFRSLPFLKNIAVLMFVFFFIIPCAWLLIFSWVFGEFLCKMYQFVHALSYTASIFILMVICMERYFAIIYPITCKQILTTKRLRVSK